MWPDPQFPADLVTFTEETLNGKLHFLCSVTLEETLLKSNNRVFAPLTRKENKKKVCSLKVISWPLPSLSVSTFFGKHSTLLHLFYVSAEFFTLQYYHIYVFDISHKFEIIVASKPHDISSINYFFRKWTYVNAFLHLQPSNKIVLTVTKILIILQSFQEDASQDYVYSLLLVKLKKSYRKIQAFTKL